MSQVRFWHFVNDGPVLLKLRQGQTLAHVEGGPTDEGYSYTAVQFEFDGATVIRRETTRAQDCDGRIDRCSDAICPVVDLAAGGDLDGVRYPAWQWADSSQRDYSAEAMGY